MMLEVIGNKNLEIEECKFKNLTDVVKVYVRESEIEKLHYFISRDGTVGMVGVCHDYIDDLDVDELENDLAIWFQTSLKDDDGNE